jgi:hypothetical protein
MHKYSERVKNNIKINFRPMNNFPEHTIFYYELNAKLIHFNSIPNCFADCIV